MTIEAMIAWREGLRYRILNGFACRLLEGASLSADSHESESKYQASVLLAELLRVATVDKHDPAEMELARQAVEDALAGRRPRDRAGEQATAGLLGPEVSRTRL